MRVVLVAVLCLGCSAKSSEDAPAAVPQWPTCAAHAVPALDGSCTNVGVPAEACTEGFRSDGAGGCAPILPADACPVGKYAAPGETECHDVGVCAEGAFPPEGTVFVSAGALGGDGSRERPFGTIQAAINAAPAANARVAVAAGKYNETITIDKPLTLEGRCASMVEIVSRDPGAITVTAPATIRGIAITKGIQGIRVRSKGVTIEDTWIHYTGGTAIVATARSSAIVRRSLIEQTRNGGVYAEGSELRIEQSAIREVEMLDGAAGLGAVAQIAMDGTPTTVTLTRSIVERAHATAVASLGSSVVLERTVLRDSLGRNDDAAVGCVLARPSGGRAPTITVQGSVLERCAGSGITIDGGALTVEHATITHGQPQPAGSKSGIGILGFGGATMIVSDSLLAHNRFYGMIVMSGELTAKRVIVRDTEPQVSDNGVGVGIAALRDTSRKTLLSVDQTIVLRARTVGIAANGSDAVITRTLVQDTDVQASDQLYGDGVQITASFYDGAPVPIEARVEDTLVKSSKRAGIAVLAADLTLARTTIACAPIPLALIKSFTLGTTSYSGPATLMDGGGNNCGCGTNEPCRAISEGVDPLAISGAR